LVEYHEFTGSYFVEEIGREIADAEDAGNAACDLEYLAEKVLRERDMDGACVEPRGFNQIVDDLIDAESTPVAAE
jgi:hypothetical protein